MCVSHAPLAKACHPMYCQPILHRGHVSSRRSSPVCSFIHGVSDSDGERFAGRTPAVLFGRESYTRIDGQELSCATCLSGHVCLSALRPALSARTGFRWCCVDPSNAFGNPPPDTWGLAHLTTDSRCPSSACQRRPQGSGSESSPCADRQLDQRRGFHPGVRAVRAIYR